MLRTHTTAVVLVVAAAVAAFAQAAKPPAKPAAPAASHTMVNAADLKWGPAPAAFQPGAQIAIIEGDPAVAGPPFVIRVKFPDGFKVQPHWHPSDENVTVLSGTLVAGMGEKWDDAAMKTLGPGGFARMPKASPHYVMARGETIVQVHAVGPFSLTYVNPNDDPRKKTP